MYTHIYVHGSTGCPRLTVQIRTLTRQASKSTTRTIQHYSTNKLTN